jgi:hypothetical protein
MEQLRKARELVSSVREPDLHFYPLTFRILRIADLL